MIRRRIPKFLPPGLYTCLLVFFLGGISFGQAVEIGMMAGLGIYNGDFSPVKNIDYFKELNPAAGVFVRHQTADRLAFRLGYTYTTLTGAGNNNTTTPYRKSDMLYRSPIHELALTMEITPFRLYLLGWEVSPYISGGPAVFYFNPQYRINGEWLDVQPLGLEGQGLPGYEEPYSRLQFSLPVGGGVRIRINERFTIGAEAIGRIVLTDYLDDVTRKTVVYDDLRRGRGEEIAQLSFPGFNPENDRTYFRGNQANDYYYSGGVTLFYNLIRYRSFNNGLTRKPSRLKCPKF